jgi:hypothetical protein
MPTARWIAIAASTPPPTASFAAEARRLALEPVPSTPVDEFLSRALRVRSLNRGCQPDADQRRAASRRRS